MNIKINMVIGVTAKGECQALYLGADADAAKQIFARAVNGEHPELDNVKLFIRPEPYRRQIVQKVQHPEAAQAPKQTLESGAPVPPSVPDEQSIQEQPSEPPVEKPQASRKMPVEKPARRKAK